jgi:hypothetical protein
VLPLPLIMLQALFASLMLNAHEGALCLQAQCPMHIHDGDLSFASLMPNAHP